GEGPGGKFRARAARPKLPGQEEAARMWSIHLSARGENNAQWQGGTQDRPNYRVEYKMWRIAVLRRDGFCMMCTSTEDLQVRHIIPWRVWPDGRHDTINGLMLCRTCHQSISAPGASSREESLASDFIAYTLSTQD